MNPEERKKYNREYREKNKERIEAYLSTKVVCKTCGRNVRYQHIVNHMKTKYCTKHVICEL